MQYTSKSEALVRAKERAAGAGGEADSFLNEFLDLSFGRDNSGTTHFRPFLAAAVWLEQSPKFQQLKKADDVEFTQMKVAIASLRSLQAGYDARYQLILPPGFEAVASAIKAVRSPIFSTSILPASPQP